MINYNSSSELKAFLEQENLGMRKKFGQNFLINPQVRNALIDALGANSGDEVWEIGPGLGAMTALLLDKGLKVKAFEIDTGFIRILKTFFSANAGFNLIEGDVLKTWQTQSAAPLLLGNLPYNIAAVLIADLIEQGRHFDRMVITVQKEVALRMAAGAGSKDYSSFSVLRDSVYKVKTLMTIRPSSFYPAPNVDSMGVLLEKRENCDYPDIFYPLVRALFASRRKTIKNNLLTFLSARLSNHGYGKTKLENEINAIFKENTLSGNERAETLQTKQFASLAKTIDNMRLLNSDANCRKPC